jgi:hypothetical protein
LNGVGASNVHVSRKNACRKHGPHHVSCILRCAKHVLNHVSCRSNHKNIKADFALNQNNIMLLRKNISKIIFGGLGQSFAPWAKPIFPPLKALFFADPSP